MRVGAGDRETVFHYLMCCVDELSERADRHDQSKCCSVDGMNLFDVIEMLMDWKAASERQDNGDIRSSLEVGIKRFSLSPQLAAILSNTIEAMGW